MKSQTYTVYFKSGRESTTIIDLEDGDEILEIEYDEPEEIEHFIIMEVDENLH